MSGEADEVGVLDALVERVLGTYPYLFTVASTPAEREIAFRIRYDTVMRWGWAPPPGMPEGQERDRYDDAAVQVVGWDGPTPISTGRLVLPPNPLPTQEECRITVPPAGEVVDVGRMCVVSHYQSHRHAAFIALLSRLYLEMRARGFAVACGVMSPRTRRLMRQLGLRLEELGEDRPYWGEPRAPVRFTLLTERREPGRALERNRRSGLSPVPGGGREHQAGVGAAEPERVGQRQPGRHASAAPRSRRRPATSAARVLQAGHGRDQPGAQRPGRHHRLDRARAADQVTGAALHRRDRRGGPVGQSARVEQRRPPEQCGERTGLGKVTGEGAGPVGVDVPDLRGGGARVLEGQPHAAQRAVPVGVRGDQVEGVRAGGIAGDARQCRAARAPRVPGSLQDQERGALAHHEPVAVGVERPGGELRPGHVRGSSPPA